MKFIKNKMTWILAIVIFSITSIIETALEGNSNLHDLMFALIAGCVWIVSSLLIVYVFKIEFNSCVEQIEDEKMMKYLDIPVLWMFLALTSVIFMVTFMILN